LIILQKMAFKKRATVLVIIALVLAITAVTLRVTDSNEVPTSLSGDPADAGNGQVGVTILPPKVEDKLAENSGENQG
jgi:hypothetical protein